MNALKHRKDLKKITTYALIALLLFSLSGCAPAEKPPIVDVEVTPPVNTPDVEVVVNDIEKSYQSILEGYLQALPSEPIGNAAPMDTQNKLVENMIQLFKDKATSKELYAQYVNGIKQLSPAQADKFTAYAISGMRRNSFEDYTAIEKYSNDPKFLENFFKEAEAMDYKYIVLNQNSENIQDPQIKELVETAKSQGYFVSSAEGMLFYLVDFTEFAKYRNYNTRPMASLIETLAIDNLDPMTSDAALIVNGSTMAARTYGIEKMMNDYKGSLYEQYLAVRFKDHMFMLFFGVNNTPTFSYETNRITEEAIDQFKDISTLENTVMGQLVGEFMTVLEANGGIIDDSAREKANQILQKIDEKYGLTDTSMTDFGQWMSGNAVKE